MKRVLSRVVGGAVAGALHTHGERSGLLGGDSARTGRLGRRDRDRVRWADRGRGGARRTVADVTHHIRIGIHRRQRIFAFDDSELAEIDRQNPALLADRRRELECEVTGSGAKIDDGVSFLQVQRANNVQRPLPLVAGQLDCI